MNATQTDLNIVTDIPRLKSEFPYVKAWRERYPHIPNPIIVDDIKPIRSQFALKCLKEIEDNPGAFKDKNGAIKFTMFLMPYNPHSKVDQGLEKNIESWNGQRCLPFGDLYHLRATSGGQRLNIKNALGVMSYLAKELKGRLLRDPESMRWMVVKI